MRPLILLVAFCLLAGCEGPAFIASTLAGKDKIKAIATLPDRPTLVMVDDPHQALGNPTLAGVVAGHIAYHLRENGAITTPFVSQIKLAEVRDRLGDEYRNTPIDQIGRLAGADQVIYVNIESAALQPAPSYYRPTALLELKVVDAVESKRLFPEPPPIIEAGAPSRGRTMEVSFRYKGLEAESAGQDAMLARKLAERVGREVARLFFDYKPDDRFKENR